jgi:hypothetical protein
MHSIDRDLDPYPYGKPDFSRSRADPRPPYPPYPPYVPPEPTPPTGPGRDAAPTQPEDRHATEAPNVTPDTWRRWWRRVTR